MVKSLTIQENYHRYIIDKIQNATEAVFPTNHFTLRQDYFFILCYNGSVGRLIMEWLTCIKSSINYIEEHIKENISIEDIAANAYVSSYYLQVGFQIFTGYSVGEYIRNRKLYLAAIALLNNQKIIDVALDYGYETPESFSKAFKRFHGFNPSQVHNHKIKRFDPLTISIEIKGGEVKDMNYKRYVSD